MTHPLPGRGRGACSSKRLRTAPGPQNRMICPCWAPARAGDGANADSEGRIEVPVPRASRAFPAVRAALSAASRPHSPSSSSVRPAPATPTFSPTSRARGGASRVPRALQLNSYVRDCHAKVGGSGGSGRPTPDYESLLREDRARRRYVEAGVAIGAGLVPLLYPCGSTRRSDSPCRS
jgi:hypothetical protein